MRLPLFSIKHPVTVVMLTLIVVVLGFMAFRNLRQEFIPEMDFGIAVVFASFDGAGPEEVENLVTRPLEMALSTVTSLRNISSTSAMGTSMIILEFYDGTDMNHAALNMRENIDMFRMILPEGVAPTVFQIDPTMFGSFSIGITGEYDLVRLRYLVEDEVMPRLERLSGVGSVTLTGGMEREISIELEPHMLVGYGLTAQQVAGVLAMENINRPGGLLRQGGVELQVRTLGEFQSIQEIENLPIITPQGAAIRLLNVARVVDGFRDISSYTLINGNPGVMLSIMEQSTANTVEVGVLVHRELDLLRQEFPALEFVIVMDTSQFIASAINSAWVTVFIAAGLAMLVLFLFLGNVRSPLIIGVSIPVSVIASLVLMYFTGMSLNLISINALVITIGLLVDNGVVVIESINRKLEEGLEPIEAARKGAMEVGLAVTVSTLTTVAVFFPVLFVGGFAGELFGELGLVISFALLSSLVVSMTFVPMACSKFLRKRDKTKPPSRLRKAWERWYGLFERFEDLYSGVLKWVLAHRAVVVAVFLGIMALSFGVLSTMGMEFMPPMDQGEISISIALPQGSLLEETSAITKTAVERISDMSEVETLSVTVGGGGMMGLFGGGGADSSNVLIQLIDRNERRSIEELLEEMRTRIEPLTGADVTVSLVDMAAMGGANRVSLNLFGDDAELLAETGDKIVQLISTLPAIRNAESSAEIGFPQAQVVVNRQRAGFYGLQAFDVANTVQMAIGGNTITRLRVDGTEVDVVMRYQPERLEFLTDLHNLMLMSPLGVSVPLAEVAEIQVEQGPASITKQNQQQFITISADFVGTDLGTTSNEISSLLDDFVFPSGMSYSFTGDFDMMMDSFAALGIAMVLGFLLLYMVIASLFESIAYPLTILFSIPVAWGAGIFGLFITGQNISVVAFVGLIVLMGIVINNGVLLVDYINIKRREGLQSYEAILFAARARLRPILMTSLSTVIGLLPMVFSTAEGAEMSMPIGIVVVFGLSFSTFITLVLIPTLYSLLHGVRKRLWGRREAMAFPEKQGG